MAAELLLELEELEIAADVSQGVLLLMPLFTAGRELQRAVAGARVGMGAPLILPATSGGGSLLLAADLFAAVAADASCRATSILGADRVLLFCSTDKRIVLDSSLLSGICSLLLASLFFFRLLSLKVAVLWLDI